jgi:solute carrier family 25 (mitochondrial aspartate/glutamate transporter), member 12/13
LANIAPENYIKKITARITDVKVVETPADRSAFVAILESAYRFTLGSIAGGKFLFSFSKTLMTK